MSTSEPLDDDRGLTRLLRVQRLFMPVPGSLAEFGSQKQYITGTPINPASSCHTYYGAVDCEAVQFHRRRLTAFSQFDESQSKGINFISHGNNLSMPVSRPRRRCLI